MGEIVPDQDPGVVLQQDLPQQTYYVLDMAGPPSMMSSSVPSDTQVWKNDPRQRVVLLDNSLHSERHLILDRAAPVQQATDIPYKVQLPTTPVVLHVLQNSNPDVAESESRKKSKTFFDRSRSDAEKHGKKYQHDVRRVSSYLSPSTISGSQNPVHQSPMLSQQISKNAEVCPAYNIESIPPETLRHFPYKELQKVPLDVINSIPEDVLHKIALENLQKIKNYSNPSTDSQYSSEEKISESSDSINSSISNSEKSSNPVYVPIENSRYARHSRPPLRNVTEKPPESHPPTVITGRKLPKTPLNKEHDKHSSTAKGTSQNGLKSKNFDTEVQKAKDIEGHSMAIGVTDPEKDAKILLEEPEEEKKGCCRRGFKGWCKKYFWEGQSLNKSHQSNLTNKEDLSKLPCHKRVLLAHRRVIGLLLPAFIYHVCWWGLAIKYEYWSLFTDKYYMSLTMILGSVAAGMTSEGGGAIAFPVMTLAFQIPPIVARDFSLMIQSCGMTAAAFTIFFMKIQLEWHSLILCSVGGAVGIVCGFYTVDPYLTPAQKKMGFVSIWFSFAFALFLLNRYHKRKTFRKIPKFNVWRGGALLLTGVIGGIFSSFAGSGLDICSFSMLTLLFRVSEKVATPTSVVLMAGNTVVGFYWRGVMSADPISQEAWDFLAVCVPIVVLGAPLGSVLGSHFHRQVLAAFVYIIDIAALVGAFVVVPQTPTLIGTSVGIIVGGFLFFMVLTYVGQKILRGIEDEEEKENNPEPQKTTFVSYLLKGKSSEPHFENHAFEGDTNKDE